MNDVFKKVAKIHGVSEQEVIDEINLAIAEAYQNPNETAKRVPRKGEVPTAEELMDFIINSCMGM